MVADDLPGLGVHQAGDRHDSGVLPRRGARVRADVRRAVRLGRREVRRGGVALLEWRGDAHHAVDPGRPVPGAPVHRGHHRSRRRSPPGAGQSRLPQGLPGESETMKIAGRMSRVALAVLQGTKRGVNNTFETMGLRGALQYGVEACAILNALDTPEYAMFDGLRRTKGLAEALKWRDAQFAPYE